MNRVVTTTPMPSAPLSPAVIVGDLVFVSGQAPVNAETGEVVGDSVGAQTAQVIANIERVLSAAGCRLDDVVKVTAFLTDMSDFAEFNAAYAIAFPTDPPARSTVGVSALPGPFRVELEAVAVLRTAGNAQSARGD